MDKYVFDNGNELWYKLIGDYYIPCLTLPAEEEKTIGIGGQQYLRYLRDFHGLSFQVLQ